jgi:hypothetical protein
MNACAVLRYSPNRRVDRRKRPVDDLRAERAVTLRGELHRGSAGRGEERTVVAERAGVVDVGELDEAGAQIAGIDARGSGRHPAFHEPHDASVDGSAGSSHKSAHGQTLPDSASAGEGASK